jgi:hypothetical protein
MITFKRTVLFAISLGLGTTGLVVAPLAAGAATSVSGVITASKAALKNEIGVHVYVKTTDGKIITIVKAQIGSDQGSEKVTNGSEKVSIVVTPTDAYLSGSKSGLEKYMGLTAAEEKKVGTSWIKIAKGSSQYTSFSTSLTAASFSAVLPAVKGTTLLSARDAKTNGYQLKWTTAATSSEPKTTSTMVIASTSKELPLKEHVTSKGAQSETTFTKWGKKISVTAPTKTIPFAKVF